MDQMNLTRFWDIIHRAENDPEKLSSLLEELTRHDMFLFNDIFVTEHGPLYGFNRGIIRSQAAPPANPKALAPFAAIVHPTMVKRCFSSDEEGSAAYPDTVITDWAWDIIERAEKNRQKLHAILRQLGKAELYRFDEEFWMAATAFDDDRFEPPPEHRHSEDGLIDLGHWIVTQGKTYYVSVWENPDTFPHDFAPDYFFFYEGAEVYEEKFGKDHNRIRYKSFYSFP